MLSLRCRQGDAYGEFICTCDLAEQQEAANAIRDAITGVRGQSYTVAQSFFLPGWGTYPTSGASDDWAFSRHFADPSQRKVRSYTIEFNTTHTFFPTWAEMQQIILDVDAGLVRFCLCAIPTYRVVFYWCWWRRWIYEAIWRRIFPPDLWGPYGPWGRLQRIAWTILSPVVTPILHLADGLFRRH